MNNRYDLEHKNIDGQLQQGHSMPYLESLSKQGRLKGIIADQKEELQDLKEHLGHVVDAALKLQLENSLLRERIDSV